MSEFVLVKNLPTVVQSALKALNFNKADIKVTASATVDLSGDAGSGSRSFTTLIDLVSERSQTIQGSWGGQNMFNPNNPVDTDHNSYPLPGNGCAITGSRGGGFPVRAELHIPASMVAKILPPSVGTALEPVEMNALAIFVAYKASYRREEFEDAGVTTAVLDGLVARDFLKRNKAGATSITVAGKNAVGSYRFSKYNH